MKKSILYICLVLSLTACGRGEVVEKTLIKPVIVDNIENQKTISVTSSIIPIGSVINTIGGDYVSVNTIIPAGMSPHGFDLSPKDLVAIEESDITFLVGLEQIDGFLEKAIKDKKHVELADGMDLIEVAAHEHNHGEEHGEKYEEHDYHGHDEHDDDKHSDEEIHSDEEEHEEHGDEHSVDPHIWLGKDNIFAIAEIVRDELSLILPEQAKYFAQNTKSFQAEIETLYTEFTRKNTGKTAKEFIVFHDAYNYMMESLGIDENLKIPFSENVLHETGTAHMADIINEIELHGIKHVFREPQFSGGTLEKFANEYGLVLGTLDPLGTDDSAMGYKENLEKNLDNFSLIYE